MPKIEFNTKGLWPNKTMKVIYHTPNSLLPTNQVMSDLGEAIEEITYHTGLKFELYPHGDGAGYINSPFEIL